MLIAPPAGPVESNFGNRCPERIRWHSTLPQPYGKIGLCYAKMGSKQAALASFEKALEIDPNYEPAILNKAATEELNEGQCLSFDFKVTRYYGTKKTSA